MVTLYLPPNDFHTDYSFPILIIFSFTGQLSSLVPSVPRNITCSFINVAAIVGLDSKAWTVKEVVDDPASLLFVAHVDLGEGGGRGSVVGCNLW